MKRGLFILFAIMLTQACTKTGTEQVSGYIKDGLRILVLTNDSQVDLTVYRGDYILPLITGSSSYTVQIPDLAVTKSYPVSGEDAVYIKMKKTGAFDFTAGTVSGKITVLEYDAVNYTELSALQAMQVISNISPFILDVRTPGEYAQAHIQDARLIPVQVLQQQIAELQAYREQPVFIYCASGNRSTVAARLLIEAGFKKIYNLRFGINDWAGKGYPIVTE